MEEAELVQETLSKKTRFRFFLALKTLFVKTPDFPTIFAPKKDDFLKNRFFGPCSDFRIRLEKPIVPRVLSGRGRTGPRNTSKRHDFTSFLDLKTPFVTATPDFRIRKTLEKRRFLPQKKTIFCCFVP